MLEGITIGQIIAVLFIIAVVVLYGLIVILLKFFNDYERDVEEE